MPNPETFWRAPALGTARELRLSGGTIRCFETGEGPTIVFVHGILANANLWRKVVARLSPRFRCISLDLPLGAHQLPLGPDADLSPTALADLIADALAELGLDAVTLVGNDTGGALCQIAVTSHPSRVGRLVLTSCDFREHFPPAAFLPVVEAAADPDGFERFLAPLRDRSLRMLPQAFGSVARRPIDDDASDSYGLPALDVPAVRENLRRVLLGLHPAPTIAAAERLRDFDGPALVAWSRQDVFFPASDARELAATIPGARLEWINDSRTFSPEDQPERLADLIGSFVAEATQAPLR